MKSLIVNLVALALCVAGCMWLIWLTVATIGTGRTP